MRLDLTLCSSFPDVFTLLVLLIEYSLILILVIYRISSTVLRKYSAREVYLYHFLCILTCILRLVTLSYAIALNYTSYDIIFLYIFTLLAPLPFVSAISLLTGTWIKMFFLLCSLNQTKLENYLKYRKIGLGLWNFLLYVIVGILIYLIYKGMSNCII